MTARARIRKILVATALLALLGTAVPGRVAAGTAVYYVAQRSSHGASHAAGGSCAKPGWVGGTDAAIQAAVNATSDGASVYICAGTYSLQNPIAVDGILNIQGVGQNKTILDGGGASQLITSTDMIALKSLTLRNGYSSDDGGAVYVLGTIRTFDVKFANNVADGDGGAIAILNAGPQVEVIENSSFVDNSAGNDGGAVFASENNCGILITKSTFSRNTAGDDGGALRLGGLDEGVSLAVTATSSTFTWNYAENDGGAIYADGDVTTVRSTFSKNAAEEDGGAIRSDAGSISISLGLFSENTAGNNGGATYSDGVVNAVNSGFERNVAGNNGGAINGGDGYVVAVKDWFTENHAPDGGAIDADSVKVARSTFTKNYASGDEGSGGAVNATVLSAMSNRFVQNHVDGEYGAGGAIAFQDELLYDATWAGIKSNQFTRNTAYGGHADGSALAQWSACQDQVPAYYLNKNTFSGNDGSGDDVALYDYCK